MTSRLLYEAVLMEIDKENAPNISLEKFNYLSNKSINNYINKRYNIYDINQQTTDDLGVLKSTAILIPTPIDTYNDLTGADNMATYEIIMPSDYLHLLNCICIYDVKKTYKCYNKGDTWRAAATRLTADAYSQVLDNFWLKPSYNRPYYYIHNVNTSSTVPTNPYSGTLNTTWNEEHTVLTDTYTDGKRVVTTYNSEGKVMKIETTPGTGAGSSGTDSANIIEEYGTDGNGNIVVQGSGNPKTINIGETAVSNVERGAGIRYGNVSKVRIEIRYGNDRSVFALKKVLVDYIKVPQNIRLTQKELDLTEDTSQILEYPDYVCQEIVNELVHLVMENISDQRLQTHPIVTLSIANPAQALAPVAAGQTA